MIRLACLLALSMALTGCNQLRAVLLSQAEKVNLAFPVAEDLVTAQNSFFSSLEEGSPKSVLTGQYAALLKIRGLTCSGTASIGSFDTNAVIKTKISDTACFKDQDAKLAEWIGIQRFVAALQKPALIPLSPLQSRAVIAIPESISSIVIARSANVIVLRASKPKFMVMQVPGGKIINSFDAPAEAYRPPTLSPNGRVLAMPIGNSALWLIDTETGVTLWKTTKFSDVTAWLPEVAATVLSGTGNSAPMLLDHIKASIEAYPVTVQRPTWSAPLAAASARYALGSGRNVAIVDHSRSVEGAITVASVKQLTLTGQGVSSSGPVLMGNGKKLVFVSVRDLGWLDIETGAQGVWNTSFLGSTLNNGPAKVSETAIYLDVNLPGTPTAARLFDIEKETISGVQGGDSNEGLLLSLAPRQGYLRRGSAALVIGNDVVAEGEPQVLEKIVSDAQLAQQLAKLNAETQQQQLQQQMQQQIQNPYLASMPAADRERYMEHLLRQPRSSPGAAGGSEIGAAYKGPAPGARPLLADVSPDAKVSFIGVYEAASTTPMPSGARIGGIRVNVMPGSTPLVLVLTSYEPVRWTINSGNRKISAILLSGNEQSSVINPGGAQVVKIGSSYAYKMDGPGYASLKQAVARYVSNPVQAFQGGYKGQDFSVN
jgi:hypothetical protein